MKTVDIFNGLNRLPGGSRVFSFVLGFTAPYFSSIAPHVSDLKPGFVKVEMKKRRKVTNHIGTVHAIAMCNMAELAGGLMTDVSIPKGARWIPAGMTVKYEKKATTDLTAIANGQAIDWTQEGDVVVPVMIHDKQAHQVFSADITMNIKQGNA